MADEALYTITELEEHAQDLGNRKRKNADDDDANDVVPKIARMDEPRTPPQDASDDLEYISLATSSSSGSAATSSSVTTSSSVVTSSPVVTSSSAATFDLGTLSAPPPGTVTNTAEPPVLDAAFTLVALGVSCEVVDTSQALKIAQSHLSSGDNMATSASPTTSLDIRRMPDPL